MTGRREIGGTKLVSLPVTITDNVLEQVDAAAEAAGLNRSQWLRRVIAEALTAREPAKPKEEIT